jgi:hypothetical protein
MLWTKEALDLDTMERDIKFDMKTKYKEWTQSESFNAPFNYFYITADDLNLNEKTIMSLYNIYPPGNIIVSFWHQEHIYVSSTLHISEFVCCLQP